eukprot:7261825-Prymnesium_polylepis.2
MPTVHHRGALDAFERCFFTQLFAHELHLLVQMHKELDAVVIIVRDVVRDVVGVAVIAAARGSAFGVVFVVVT